MGQDDANMSDTSSTPKLHLPRLVISILLGCLVGTTLCFILFSYKYLHPVEELPENENDAWSRFWNCSASPHSCPIPDLSTDLQERLQNFSIIIDLEEKDSIAWSNAIIQSLSATMLHSTLEWFETIHVYVLIDP